MQFTYEEVKEAYIKLKTYVYYDTSNLFLRKQLATFETDLYDEFDIFKDVFAYQRFRNLYNVELEEDDIKYEAKLRVFTAALNSYDLNPEYFKYYLQEVNPRFIPKKIKTDEETTNIITNKRTADNYYASRTTVFIDAPIEIHLVTVLWILKVGYKLDRDLFDGCLGNRLVLNKNKDGVVQGSALFKPYPKQYQKWRDDSVEIAREHIKNGEDVLLLNLDIKDYFYSVRIEKENIYNSESIGGYSNLLNIFSKIHEQFTLELSTKYKTPYDFSSEVTDDNKRISHVVLPIGLLSSFILANHYLQSFDERIIHKSKPVYYGRYVDDILMVLTSPQIPGKNDDKIAELNFDYDNYPEYLNKCDFDEEEKTLKKNWKDNINDLERFILENFTPIICLIEKPKFLRLNSRDKEDQEHLFKINGYKRLYCQSEKTLLYFFDKDESELVIDKLKKELEAKSSEFRNYDNENDDDDFEKSAYHLLYDGTEGKVRTLKDYKEDRFGISVYLTKKIFNALRTSDCVSDEEAEKIVKLFRGSNTLNFHTLWEKSFTYLLINNKPFSYVKFYLNCNEAIHNLKPLTGSIKISTEDYQNDLFEYLDCAHEMALALNPQFLAEIKKVKRTFEFSFNKLKNSHPFFQERYSPTDENSYFLRRFRKSNLIRHHYVSQPLINYCKLDRLDTQSYKFSKIPFLKYSLDDNKLRNSPRNVKFWECCLAVFIENLGAYKSNAHEFVGNYVPVNIYSNKKNEYYLDKAYDYYFKANFNHKPQYETIDNKGKEDFFNLISSTSNFEYENKINKIIKNEFYFSANDRRLSPKIAVASTHVQEDNIKSSLRGKPNLSSERFDTLFKIFQQTKNEGAELLLFPECFVPIELLSLIIWFAVKQDVLVVTGLEHITRDGVSFNFIVTILPFEKDGIKDATVVYRLKNHYSHAEELMILTNHFKIPRPIYYVYNLFNWKGIYFSSYYCFELANVLHRSLFKGKIDLLIASEWNPDTNYFSNIVESISRDLHVFVAQVNTSQYGDTRLTSPSETAKKDILRLKGGINDTILIGIIDIIALREFQRELYITTKDDKRFKPLPPDFELKDVITRINNEPFLFESPSSSDL